MLTLKLDSNKATLPEVCRRLNISPVDVDQEFGVVNIDPQRDLYAILVEEAAAEKAGQQEGVAGPFSNPKIEPFGPPQKSK